MHNYFFFRTITTSATPTTSSSTGLLQKKEEKISFKFLPPEKSAAVANAIKTINAVALSVSYY